MNILRKPIISEKSMGLVKSGEYTFLVDKNATKLMIAKIVAEKFNVKVLGVKTITIKGKTKMQKRARTTYLTPSFKKAIVSLKKGDKIGIFESDVKEKPTVTTVEGEVIKEKKNILRNTKVRVERIDTVSPQSTQRKVIGGK